jgi:hypothetical protein
LFPQRRDLLQQTVPCLPPLREAELVGHLLCDRNAGAGYPVVEMQQPNPTTVENMMNGRIFGGIGQTIQVGSVANFAQSSHSRKMAVEGLRCRIFEVLLLRESE